MKKLLFYLPLSLLLLSLLCIGTLGCTAPKEPDPPQPSDSETETEAKPEEPAFFDLFSDGAYRCAIVIPKDASSVEFRMANQLLAFLISNTKVRTSLVAEDQLDGTFEHLILIGETDFEESKALYQGLSARSAAVEVKNGKLCIGFQSIESGTRVVENLIDALQTTEKNEVSLSLPYQDAYTALPNADELPAYLNATTIDCGDDSKMAHAVSDKESFLSYCQSVEALGFKKTNVREQAGNLFYTFEGENDYVYAYFTAYNNEVRVLTGPTDSLAPIDLSCNAAETHTPYIASIPQPNNGLGYIFRLPDGRFIIYDGGYDGGDLVYTTLQRLVPEGEITVAAWILTHPHLDHYGAFSEYFKLHGNDKSIKIEAVMLNLAYTDYYDIKTSERTEDCTSDVEAIRKALKGSLSSSTKVYKLHTGQVLKFGSVEAEVLYTPEDLIPQPLANVNNSSLVMRLKFGADSVMLLADTAYESGPILNKLWGSYLKTNILQVAHHGQWASVEEIYHSIQAETLLIPAVTWRLKEYLLIKEGVSTMKAYLKYAVDLYVSGDEMQIIELPYVIQNNKNAALKAVNPDLVN